MKFKTLKIFSALLFLTSLGMQIRKRVSENLYQRCGDGAFNA